MKGNATNGFLALASLLSALCSIGCGDHGDGGGQAPREGVYRFESFAVKDPPAAIESSILGVDCSTNLFEMAVPAAMIEPSINEGLNDAITMDQDMDGFLDLSFLVDLGEGDITQGGTARIVVGKCTPDRDCEPDPDVSQPPDVPFTYMESGPCVDVEPDAVDAGANDPGAGGAPCIATEPVALPLPVSQGELEFELPLRELVAAAEIGDVNLVNGVLKGFLAKSDADAIVLNDEFGTSVQLSFALPGGADEPLTVAGYEIQPCGDASDLDTGPDGELGWWLYVNFHAEPPGSYAE